MSLVFHWLFSLSLTFWLLKDVVVIFKSVNSSWAVANLLTGECHRKHMMKIQHWFITSCNGLVPSGSVPLPEPMLTQINAALWPGPYQYGPEIGKWLSWCLLATSDAWLLITAYINFNCRHSMYIGVGDFIMKSPTPIYILCLQSILVCSSTQYEAYSRQYYK